jgi:hypothetical protein
VAHRVAEMSRAAAGRATNPFVPSQPCAAVRGPRRRCRSKFLLRTRGPRHDGEEAASPSPATPGAQARAVVCPFEDVASILGRMNLRSIVIAAVALPLAIVSLSGCQEGACVVPAANNTTTICMKSKKSGCEEGKGNTYVGGDCPAAGFTKHNEAGDYWEK